MCAAATIYPVSLFFEATILTEKVLHIIFATYVTAFPTANPPSTKISRSVALFFALAPVTRFTLSSLPPAVALPPAPQGLGVIVVAAVAFLAVAQQQLRGGGESSTNIAPDFHLEAEALDDGTADGEGGGGDGRWMGGTGGKSDDDRFFGLVGLSLTYALPIVGGLVVTRSFLGLF